MILVSLTSIAQENNEVAEISHDQDQIILNSKSSEKIAKEKAGTVSRGEFAHVVLFWLNNPDNLQERKKFEASLEKFIKNSEYIKTIHLGSPANTNRPVIDNTYTYCMILTFTSKEEQDKYQDEPGHKAFIAESEELWEKVIVYDSVNFL